ncbi:MAG TPA: PhzF family phenazine biosynthesis protein [Pseudolabrys sp.]|jgi:trans-2,3-dihydro-3-hydroxyanthranilate isomerase|nr:PhzF family phenazine biosynthesis protein [Pseudolabrys sp.]
MHVDFKTVDVFTDRRFGGNPLAVVLDARGLTDEQMQSIAAEFNLAETTFVLPPRHAAHTAEVRIFTPRAELPFAGHPNIGTAFVLAAQGGVKEPLAFEEKAGLVRLDVLRDGPSVVGARLAAPQPFARGDDVSLEAVAKACSLDAGDVETANHHPCIASCGVAFVFAELKARPALVRARPRADVFSEHFPMDRATGIFMYTRSTDGEVDIYARMFAPLYGVPEDPATGSANVALAGFLAGMRPEQDLALRLRISQGREMGRPSLLQASAEKRDGQLAGMWIGGLCVSVMQGRLEV